LSNIENITDKRLGHQAVSVPRCEIPEQSSSFNEISVAFNFRQLLPLALSKWYQNVAIRSCQYLC